MHRVALRCAPHGAVSGVNEWMFSQRSSCVVGRWVTDWSALLPDKGQVNELFADWSANGHLVGVVQSTRLL